MLAYIFLKNNVVVFCFHYFLQLYVILCIMLEKINQDALSTHKNEWRLL
ncbi:hypothetical protein BACPEC_00589 [[Bacteroides] pectinophilus ATCC 43243]|uniref:Uncharacterized protein n=1 Tax=[Bacteroides] pectinophilus ATCC 43243 TaxID=483218 RepID=B7API3_9FIRM|nr:hypothetical protein BACPEC_00589 [[Bacteroides] pectinophilus ATCC 43243]